MAIDASDKMMAVAWYGISREWPESCWWWAGVNFCWTFETNNSCNGELTCKKKLINANKANNLQVMLCKKIHLLDYKCVAIGRANCNHEYVHHKLNHHHNGAVTVRHVHISNKLWSILDYLDRYRKRIRILVLKSGLLSIWKSERERDA